jgi:hypothetical protein
LFDGNALYVTGDTETIGTELLQSCRANVGVGLTQVCQVPTSSGSSAVFDYFINNAGVMRSGQILAVWDGSIATYTEYSTPDLNGSTAPFRFNVTVSGGNVIVEANVASGVWDVSIGTRVVF